MLPRWSYRLQTAPRSRDTLRGAACFNVVPLHTGNVAGLSQATWERGVEWAIAALEHVAPDGIVCNGKGSDRSAWNIFTDRRFDITEVEEVEVYGTSGSSAGESHAANWPVRG